MGHDFVEQKENSYMDMGRGLFDFDVSRLPTYVGVETRDAIRFTQIG